MPRTAIWLTAILAMTALCRPAAARLAAADEKAPLRDVRVESVQLSNVDRDGLEIALRISATANVTATLQYIVFDQTTIGPLRVSLPPAEGPVRLRDGGRVEFPPLEARLSYRELDSLEPLRRILREQRARVQGVLRGRLALSMLQRLSLLSRQAWVVSRIDQDVPLTLAGGTFAQMAGVFALTLAEPLWATSRERQRRLDAAAIEQARMALEGSLVAVETRYSTKQRDSEIAARVHLSTGFIVGDGLVLITAEAAEPWLFDAGLAEALHQRELDVVDTSTDIVLLPLMTDAAARGALTLQRRQLRVTKVLKRSENAISPTTRDRFHMRFRGLDENAALIAVDGLGGRPLRPFDATPSSGWQSATVVSLRRHGDAVTPIFQPTSVRWAEGRFVLRDLMDPEALGSPIWTAAGVVGVVQDETSGASLRAVLDKLGR